jgi:hypothetical protein
LEGEVVLEARGPALGVSIPVEFLGKVSGTYLEGGKVLDFLLCEVFG